MDNQTRRFHAESQTVLILFMDDQTRADLNIVNQIWCSCNGS